MKMELVLRFNSGSNRALGRAASTTGLLAVAGPDHGELRTPVRAHGKDLPPLPSST